MSAGARSTNGGGVLGQARRLSRSFECRLAWARRRDGLSAHRWATVPGKGESSAQRSPSSSHNEPQSDCGSRGNRGRLTGAMNRRILELLPFAMVAGATVLVSCTTTTTVICPDGKANCPCRAPGASGGVCNEGLVCLPAENRCADLTGSGYVLAQDAASSGDDQSTADELPSSSSDDASGPPPGDDASLVDTSSPSEDSSQPVESGNPPAEAGPSEGGGGGSEGGVAGNLVTNGDFSQGMSDWAVQGGSNASGFPSAATPYLCVTLNNNVSYVIGWTPPSPLDLPPGTSYTLSYKAWTTGSTAVDVEAKVGLSYSPYTADLDVNSPQDSVQTSQTFVHTFTTTTDDPSAGIAFLVVGSSATSGNNICFDDVTLVRN